MTTDVIAYEPRFKRYPPGISHLLGEIRQSLGAIKAAPILPSVADEIRSNARVGTIHYSNLIEGNPLPVSDARRASENSLKAASKAERELVNYVAALDLIDDRIEAGNLQLNVELLLEIHAAITAGLGDEGDEHFKPHHEGAWRDGEAVVVDGLTQQIMHEGCHQTEVEPRMLGLFDWITQKWDRTEWPPFIIAGAAHHAVTEIHPFADGNGRAARLLQGAILLKAEVLPKRMFSFERYYAEDKNAYYSALRSVKRNTGNMEEWLEYFLEGLRIEYSSVLVRVEELSDLLSVGGEAQVQLSPTQQRALLELGIRNVKSFSRSDYENIAQVSASEALSDLNQLIETGAVSRRGAGRGIRYHLASAKSTRASATGRPRSWTAEKIERELREFTRDIDSWPTPKQFREAGLTPLYVAASRHGGIPHWKRVLQFS